MGFLWCRCKVRVVLNRVSRVLSVVIYLMLCVWLVSRLVVLELCIWVLVSVISRVRLSVLLICWVIEVIFEVMFCLVGLMLLVVLIYMVV